MTCNQKAPLVSIIIAAYNAECFLDAAIASVVAQTMTEWELFVIDDHSKDGTYAIAKAWEQKDDRIHALTNEQNQGVSRTRNRGIDLSRGEWIAFLDADDIWYPEKLEQQLQKKTVENVGIIYCSYNIMDTEGKRISGYRVPERASVESMLRENVISCIAMVIPAEVMKNIKFRTDFFHEDYVLALDILKAGYCAVGCTEPLAEVRRVKGSRSFGKLSAAINRWKIYRDYLKLPIHKSIAVFALYAWAGIKKYYLKIGAKA